VEGSVRIESISSLMLGRYSLYVESSLKEGERRSGEREEERERERRKKEEVRGEVW
jgi:hypothetical protein